MWEFGAILTGLSFLYGCGVWMAAIQLVVVLFGAWVTLSCSYNTGFTPGTPGMMLSIELNPTKCQENTLPAVISPARP